jgi:hypothetical protein
MSHETARVPTAAVMRPMMLRMPPSNEIETPIPAIPLAKQMDFSILLAHLHRDFM